MFCSQLQLFPAGHTVLSLQLICDRASPHYYCAAPTNPDESGRNKCFTSRRGLITQILTSLITIIVPSVLDRSQLSTGIAGDSSPYRNPTPQGISTCNVCVCVRGPPSPNGQTARKSLSKKERHATSWRTAQNKTHNTKKYSHDKNGWEENTLLPAKWRESDDGRYTGLVVVLWRHLKRAARCVSAVDLKALLQRTGF